MDEVEVVREVPDKQVSQLLQQEVTVDLVFNFQHHLEIQHQHQVQLVVV